MAGHYYHSINLAKIFGGALRGWNDRWISWLPIGRTSYIKSRGGNEVPSPCLSVNWMAWISLMVSSTLRPMGRSLMVDWRTILCLSMMNNPRSATPESRSTPNLEERLLSTSASRGSFIGPNPPSLRGSLVQARWEYSESTLAARTFTPKASNSAILSLKEINSVGQTKVLKVTGGMYLQVQRIK